jgi:hypothetical protein
MAQEHRLLATNVTSRVTGTAEVPPSESKKILYLNRDIGVSGSIRP